MKWAKYGSGEILPLEEEIEGCTGIYVYKDDDSPRWNVGAIHSDGSVRWFFAVNRKCDARRIAECIMAKVTYI